MATFEQKHIEEPIADQGIIKWFEPFKTPTLDTGGKLIGTTGIAQDITQRKQMEAERQQSHERARRALGSTVDAIAAVVERRDSGLDCEHNS